MSALNPQLVAHLVRQRLGLPDDSQSARIIFLIPEALKRTARKVALDPKLRDLMMSDKSTTSLTITAGKVDLTTGYSTHRFLLEFIHLGQIYHSSVTYPLQKLEPVQGQIAGYLGTNSGFSYYYIEGKYLVLPNAETGSLNFAVPTYPATLAQLPTSEEIQTIFLDKIIEMLPEVNGNGGDYAEDGVK